MTVSDYVILIACTATAIVSVINAIAIGWGRKEARAAVATAATAVKTAEAAVVDGKAALVEAVSPITEHIAESGKKLDAIQTQTNGSLTELKTKYDDALRRIERLEGQNDELRRRASDAKA